MNTTPEPRTLVSGGARHGYFSVPEVDGSERLPFSLKVVLENLLRNRSSGLVGAADIAAAVARGRSGTVHDPAEIAFHPSRVFLHDTNGVPVLTDLAALRDAAAAEGLTPQVVDTRLPAHMTVDHSVVTDLFGRPDAPQLNVRREYERNSERYRFLKWGQQAFETLRIVPPGAGIMHQVNIEYLADVVTARDGLIFPDTVAGTDSHTTMVNGLAVLAWGVGGLEAEAALLGQPVSMLIPPVVGVSLMGELRPGVTATDLVLALTERMRQTGVVGSFVEFFGPGVAATTVETRCTIANMSPEFGSTCAVFPPDARLLDYLTLTGRAPEHVGLVRDYFEAQQMWHDPSSPPVFDHVVEFDLDQVAPSVAGPRRPQDRVGLGDVPKVVGEAVPDTPMPEKSPGHGAVAIASITSCTNTSNPAVMIAAGLLARNAVRRGLRTPPWVKTSLAPGSTVVTDYLHDLGLIEPLEELGFGLVGYGCMTCIGNSGDLLPEMTTLVRHEGLAAAAVLSGNRNFDGRINNDVSLNFLASPPLVVAFGLAGRTDLDLTSEPLALDADGRPVMLADLWPSDEQVAEAARGALTPEMFRRAYATLFDGDENWRSLEAPEGPTFAWDPDSTYLQPPPFVHPTPRPDHGEIRGARVLELLGDSVTTDHICPAGRIPSSSPAGRFLTARGVDIRDLNSYASRRGNWQVMELGGFGNQRLVNHLVPGLPGGHTLDLTAQEPQVVDVPTAARAYSHMETPLLVIGGKEYGSGSSRDWAAKVTALLGVRAVLAESFERIHRSNLANMGVLPLEFSTGEDVARLGLDGHEVFDITGVDADGLASRAARVRATHPRTGRTTEFEVTIRLDTERERQYYLAGGLLPYVLDDIRASARERGGRVRRTRGRG
ncbi:aconitate hydratase [Knoellia sinensis KCTC 19936]|uniref:Aconitate hydratase n=1 Tax=Knoellia sinensis KCTC 19936 TaxID=1385520 RepID=A0A0A0J891_9MICO|nr:aconitate hydratase AcnA [Knoellia sinensis]KGN31851.1 aconitate hydratase [Knoellia sinensis KCTC 19936]